MTQAGYEKLRWIEAALLCLKEVEVCHLKEAADQCPKEATESALRRLPRGGRELA